MNRRHSIFFVWMMTLGISGVMSFGQVPTVWQSRGVGAGGALYSPSINPANDNEYYVASDMSGLYRTTDFGNSYSTVNFKQVQGGHESAVRFTVNPLVAYTVTYAGGNNAQPAKTIDGGVTWAVLPGNPLADDEVYSIWADYNNAARVIVAGYSQLYFSANGGASFSLINVPINTANGALIAGVFFDGNNIYIGTNAGLLVSTNAGASFINAGTPGIPAGELMLSFTAAKAGGQMRFFCLTAQSAYPGIDLGADYYGNFRGIYSLENGSGAWAQKNTGLNPAADFLLSVAMAQNDLNTVYAGGGSSAGVPVVFKTTNAGGLWTNTFRTTNNQNINTGWSGSGGDRGWGYGEVVFGLAVAPSNSSKAVFTDYGFVHRTSNAGSTWQQAYVAVADQHGVNTTAIAGGSYHSVGLEDTTAWQVFWTSPQHLFAGFSDIKGIRSLDGGVTWSLNYTGHSANSMYRIVRHPATLALYAATSDIHDLYQSTRLSDSPLNNADANGKVIVSLNEGAGWQTVHNFGHPVFWLCLDPANPNRMYASVVHSTAGGIFVTNNLQDGASSTWTKLPNPPRTEGHPACIIVLNDGKVAATYSGRRTSAFTASSGVFLYDPGTQGWTDVSDPGMRYWTKDLVVDPADPTQSTWYVGVFSGWGGPPNGLGGLYRTVDRGAHWIRINNLDRVTSITFNPTDSSQAFLTTETDGLWHTSNLRAPSPTFTLVSSYPFRQPERVLFNPYDSGEVWVTSFGNGLMVGKVGSPPLIVTQPASQGVAVGRPAAFTVGAMGSGLLAYQWRKNGVNLAGATGATYTIASVSLSDAGSYSVVVSNGVGPVTSANAVLTVWTAAGSDFNADGRPDILLENSVTGQRTLWIMNGSFVAAGVDLGVLDLAWDIVGTADFSGDGRPDILLENSASGQRVLWLMGGPNNQYVTLGLDLGFLDPAWHIAGTADFNGDGKPDILLENQLSGQRVLWLMGGPNNQYVTLGLDLGFLDPAWQMVGLADFNADGGPDILLENSVSGQRVLWLMGGPNNQYVTLGLDLGFLDPAWHMVGAMDLSADGRPDILLENTASGQRVLWVMGGPNNQYVTVGLDLGFLDPAWRVVN